MKVRHKSEIAEAVQWDGTMETWPLKTAPEDIGATAGYWIIKIGSQAYYLSSPDEFAAHYEPVPEPAAPCQCVCHIHGLHSVQHINGDGKNRPCYCTRAAPSVSEEQPWPKENQVMKRIRR